MREGIPWTVWVFIAAMISTLIVVGLPGELSTGNPKLAVALTVLWSVLLIRRSRTAWRILVRLYALAAITLVGLTTWPWSLAPAAVIALIGASLGALLAPPTRRWVGSAL